MEASKTYYYKIAVLDYNGNVDYHGPISAIETGIRSNNNPKRPDTYILGQNYPNPFNQETVINFVLNEIYFTQTS